MKLSASSSSSVIVRKQIEVKVCHRCALLKRGGTISIGGGGHHF